jgi:hypothetical protein
MCAVVLPAGAQQAQCAPELVLTGPFHLLANKEVRCPLLRRSSSWKPLTKGPGGP